MHGRRSTQSGFTLTELVMTIAIAGTLLTLATPSLRRLLASIHTTTAQAHIAMTLRYARYTAITRSRRVLVCPSTDGQHCEDGFAWHHGWLVALDANRDGNPDPGAGLMRYAKGLPEDTHVLTSSGRRKVVFHADGSAAGSNAIFTICHTHRTAGKAVVIANSGRVRVAPTEPQRLAACVASLD